MQMYPGQMYTSPLIEPSATELYYTMSIWYVAECRCTRGQNFFPQYTCQMTEMLSCNYSQYLVITCWVVCSGLIRNYLMNHFLLYEQRGHISIFCSQHLMQVMNCSVAQNIHSGLSHCQQRKLLCIYVLLNTWYRWLTIVDITLCAAFTTDGTTLSCMHISNSSQSTLKNIHVVNTCSYDDFYYDLILAYSIYVNQILSLITLTIIVHGFSCTKKY